MQCPTCQSNNPAYARFCATCGTPFTEGEAGLVAEAASATPLPTGQQFAGPVAPVDAPFISKRNTDKLADRDQPAPVFVPPSLEASFGPLPASSLVDGGLGPNPTYLASQPTQPYQPYPAQAPQGSYQPALSSFDAQPVQLYQPAQVGRSNFGLWVGLLLLLLVVLGSLAGYLIIGKDTATLVAVAPASSATPAALPTTNQSVVTLGDGAKGTDKQVIVKLINDSNAAQTQAMRTLDGAALKQFYSGDEYDKNNKILETLRTNDAYAIQKLEKIKINDVTIDGDKATAHTVEVWSRDIYTSAGKLVKSEAAQTLHETYTCVKQNGKWLVSVVDIVEDGQQPDTQTR